MKCALILVVVLSSLHLMAPKGISQQPRQPGPIFKSFLMSVTEDGKEASDNFEIWEVVADFKRPKSSCSIRVASFATEDSTHVFLWNHEAQRITEIQPGVFKVELNGRMSPFSGLDVVIELSSDRSRILDLSGSMRAGSKGQAVRAFHVDRKNKIRQLPPLYNPSWLLPVK